LRVVGGGPNGVGLYILEAYDEPGFSWI